MNAILIKFEVKVMKISKYITLLFISFYSLMYSQENNELKINTLQQYPQDKIQTDEFGNKYYYDETQKAKIYEINGETVVVLDELVMMSKPKFNNQLDKNYYYFLNKKLNRVYPLFLTALGQYRQLEAELTQYKGKERRQYIKNKQNELATEYEAQLRDLTTTEGQVFAKLMYRATGKTVFEIIKELRGGWSAFWWNVKGNIANVNLKEPYDPYKDRTDQFIENLLQSNWNLRYLTPYEGYRDFKVSSKETSEN